MSISKKELYNLIDSLPEEKIPAVKGFLEFLLSNTSPKDPWPEFLKNAPEDDEPLDEEDLIAIEQAKQNIDDGKVIPWEQVKKEFGL